MELTVDRIAVGGKGLGLDPSGRATFVTGSFPTERVLVELTKQKKRFAEGNAVEILEPSRDRVVPECPHARGEIRCGGCDWQDVSAQGQRRLRVAMVEDALRRIGKIDTSALLIRSGRPLPVSALSNRGTDAGRSQRSSGLSAASIPRSVPARFVPRGSSFG